MGKGGGSQTTTMALDPGTQEWLEGMRSRAGREAHEISRRDPRSYFPGATGTYGEGVEGLRNLGQASAPWMQDFMGRAQGLTENLGFASQFDPEQLSRYYNPYESQVVAGSQADWDRQRELASVSARQQATRAGAFGGSRSAVLEAGLLGDIGRGETSQLANLRSAGYGQAMGAYGADRDRAGMMGLAGMESMYGGMGYMDELDRLRSSGLMEAGEYERSLQERQNQANVWAANQEMQIRNFGLGPYGQTQTTQGAGGNALGGAAGGAMTGFGIGGPIGGLIGGGLGLLGGLF